MPAWINSMFTKSPNLSQPPISLPRVWIVIVNFNGWSDTIECLAHLERLDFPSFSTVVVDNGSTDGSATEIRKRYPTISLIEKEQNLGFGAGNNVGIRYALERGADFVWLLNNDTLPPPSSLLNMVKAAKSTTSSILVGSVLVFAHDPQTVQAWGGGIVRPLLGATKHLTSPGDLDYITAASLLAPKSLFEQVGLFDEHFFLYWEDTDLCRRAYRAGWRFKVAGGEPIMHKHSTSTKSEMLRMREFADIHFVRGMVRFFRKHGGLTGHLSIVIRMSGMIFNRLRRGQPANVRAILDAQTYAVQQPLEPKNARPLQSRH
jgi:GT2 family glycosyltransferase